MSNRPTILLCCGELSGDQHASVLIEELRRRLPRARILAMGGDRCARAGAELLFHIKDYSVLGFSGVITGLGKFLRLERRLIRVLKRGVDLFIPVDYPGLNLRLAGAAGKLGIPVLYYISPQIWAWGEGRLEKIQRVVDRMAVILPFEEEIYRRRGIPAEYVGHPFVVDRPLPPPEPEASRTGIGLLPGSRIQEVRRILPVLLAAAAYIVRERPDEPLVIGRNPAVPGSLYRHEIERSGLEVEVDDNAVGVMARSRVLLVASGTATLQAALLETPLLIIYRVSPLNYFLARRLVKLDCIGLVNIVLGEKLCAEFIQSDARPERVAEKALSLLQPGRERMGMIGKFRTLRSLLAGGEGCRRVAEMAEELISRS
jgi:lipid-A-disaccharide synthase